MKKNLREFIALILISCLWIQACRKPGFDASKKELINGQVTLDMNIEDIYAALPQQCFTTFRKTGFSSM